MVPTLFGVTLLTFLLFNVFGGDPAQRYAGKHATAEQVALIKTELGLDRSLPEQYIFFLKQIVTFDYGRSWASKQAISTMISDGIGATLSVTIVPFFAGIVVCTIFGLLCTYFRKSIFDNGIVVICLALLSISSLVYILAMQNVLAYQFGMFPISGWDPSWTERWQYLTLPWLILFVLNLGSGILFYRTIFMDEVFQDYVRTARAKGLNSKTVYLKHILKNALIPIITIVVIEIPFLITGTVLIESFFGIPGLGGIVIKALQDSDFPVIKAMTVISAILYMLFNLVSDIMYTIVDPRVKLR
jgi:peptide/nickel transport system permease protein